MPARFIVMSIVSRILFCDSASFANFGGNFHLRSDAKSHGVALNLGFTISSLLCRLPLNLERSSLRATFSCDPAYCLQLLGVTEGLASRYPTVLFAKFSRRPCDYLRADLDTEAALSETVGNPTLPLPRSSGRFPRA